MLYVGAFVEGELYPSWMQFFPSLFLPLFFLYLLFLLLFLFIQGLTGGHCLGMVTRADSVTHKYFHRDEKAGS
jgi:uncharacterized protein involved in cysteine biosynthesis